MATGAIGHTHVQLHVTGTQEAKEYSSYQQGNKHNNSERKSWAQKTHFYMYIFNKFRFKKSPTLKNTTR